MRLVSDALSRRSFLGAATAIGAGSLIRPARAEMPKLKTVEDGYITIAMTGTMPLTGWQDGKLQGSDAMMIQAIAEKLGLKAKPALMAWSATIQAIRSGRADIMCGDMGWSKARAEAMLLTDPIYYASNFITMLKDKPAGEYVNVAALKDATVGTITGTTYAVDLKKIPGIKSVMLYDNVDSCLRDVVAGRSDYAVLDSMAVDYMLLQQPNLPLKQVPMTANADYPSLTGRSAIIMGMSLDNPDLFDAVNDGIKWLWATKKNAEILAENGMKSPDYLVPYVDERRIGVDRDAAGNILGPAAHKRKDFSAYFA